MVGGIILAAGASSRMGSPKALVDIGVKTFVRHLVDVLNEAGIEDIVVVLGAEAGSVGRFLDPSSIVINPQWRKGQLSSLLVGLDATCRKNPEAVLVCPVDHPLVSSSLIRRLVDAWRFTGKEIVIPVFGGVRGHPVVFSASMFGALRNASPEIGARDVLWTYPECVLELPTRENGVILNIDRPKDYEEALSEAAPLFRVEMH